MGLWNEITILTVDVVAFVISYSGYLFYRATINHIEKAEKIGINPDPSDLTEDEKVNVIVKGSVAAVNNQYVQSFYTPSLQGVIQKVTVTEHDIYKNVTGLRVAKQNIIEEITNTVPFSLKDGRYVVHVAQAKDYYILDLDTVAFKFESIKMGIVDKTLSFFIGVKQRGIGIIEEMLKEGTVITGVGELSEQNGVKTLTPPTNGGAYILTVAQIPDLLHKLKSERTAMRTLSYIFGAVGVVMVAMLARRGYKFLCNKKREREMSMLLEEYRRQRRASARTSEEIPDSQRCVVCTMNPRELILLPCGHICLCEDCSKNISAFCPICRSVINSKYAVFF